MNIPESAYQGVYKYLGDHTDDFIALIQIRLEKYSKMWQLTNLTFMSTNTVNLLFSCESMRYGCCVLKMCIPGPEVATEIHCLQAYEGKGYCKLWAFDLSDDVLLLERIIPGTQLWAVADYRERARLMATEMKGLFDLWESTSSDAALAERLQYNRKAGSCQDEEWLSDDSQEQYPTYLSWCTRAHDRLAEMVGMEEVLAYLDQAIDVHRELKQKYPKSYLLHGDLHHENILLNGEGRYIIIDPKGVVDLPVMEIARFLLNEVDIEGNTISREEEKIREIVAIVSPILEIPQEDILKSLFIDAVLSSSWTLEEHFPTEEAFDEERQKTVAMCKFARLWRNTDNVN